MRMIKLLSTLFCAVMCTCVLSAQIVLFDDAYQNGLTSYAGGGSSSTIVTSPSPVYAGTSSMEWNAGNFSLSGVNGLGSFTEYPILEFYRYKTSGAYNRIALRLGGAYTTFEIASDGTHDQYISFDGVQGYNSASDQWFKVQIDIGGMMDDNIITSSVNAIQVGNSSGSDIWYVDNMRKVAAVPEPSTLMLTALGLVAGTALLRRRRN